MKNKYQIIYGENHIQIVNKLKEEVVYWDINEWTEDPQVAFSIFNAIEIASKGKDLEKIFKTK